MTKLKKSRGPAVTLARRNIATQMCARPYGTVFGTEHMCKIVGRNMSATLDILGRLECISDWLERSPSGWMLTHEGAAALSSKPFASAQQLLPLESLPEAATEAQGELEHLRGEVARLMARLALVDPPVVYGVTLPGDMSAEWTEIEMREVCLMLENQLERIAMDRA